MPTYPDSGQTSYYDIMKRRVLKEQKIVKAYNNYPAGARASILKEYTDVRGTKDTFEISRLSTTGFYGLPRDLQNQLRSAFTSPSDLQGLIDGSGF